MSGAGRPDAAVVDASGLSLAIVATRWHQEITDSLVARGIEAAIACGISDPLVVRVPGAVELPVVAAELARHHDAVAHPGAVLIPGRHRRRATAGCRDRAAPSAPRGGRDGIAGRARGRRRPGRDNR